MSQLVSKVSDDELRPYAVAIHRALDRWEQEGTKWPDQRMVLSATHNDEFSDALIPIYARDHDAMVAEVIDGVFGNLLRVSKLFGVRFVSINKRDFYCFEGFGFDQGPNWSSRPAAWEITQQIDRLGLAEVQHRNSYHNKLWSGCGNGPQAQVNFVRIMSPKGSWGDPVVPESLYGIYDLRGDEPVMVAPPLALQTTYSDIVQSPLRDDFDPLAYFTACGSKIDGYAYVRHGEYYRTGGTVMKGDTPLLRVSYEERGPCRLEVAQPDAMG